MQTFKKILSLLTAHERKNAALLLLMILMMALLDMIGVASILPFMSILSNPGLIETNIFYNKMFEISKTFGVENDQQFIFALGILFFLILITSIAFKALTTYVQVRFIQMRQYNISKRLIENYLHMPYTWFLNRNSAELAKSILVETHIVVGAGVTPVIEIIAKTLITIAIIALLIIADPKLALITGFFLIGTYVLIFKILHKYLVRFGKARLKSNELRFISVSEAFGAAKEVKIGGLEQTYIKRFSNPAYIYAQSQATAVVISELPRFAFEAITFGGILLMILYLMTQSVTYIDIIPIMSLYVFAGYRLMPALQKIYSSFTSLAGVGPSLDKLSDDMKKIKPSNSNQDQGILPFNKVINLKNIYYNYPDTSRTALNDINISIPAKTTVALVGTTGSGKTTTADIILGLLEPQRGTLEVDGQIITENNSRSWQRSIGYVPQHIFLADDTIAANIAFGVESGDINQEAVEKVSKIANLHDFIMDELPNQYQTTIGERGIRLSGGQRQRIGIARALYNNPKVLVLDEATSALDNQTEQAVMDAVNNIGKDMTIILIAHRLNTLKNCDIIFKLEKGKVIDQGTFEKLIINEYV